MVRSVTFIITQLQGVVQVIVERSSADLVGDRGQDLPLYACARLFVVAVSEAGLQLVANLGEAGGGRWAAVVSEGGVQDVVVEGDIGVGTHSADTTGKTVNDVDLFDVAGDRESEVVVGDEGSVASLVTDIHGVVQVVVRLSDKSSRSELVEN